MRFASARLLAIAGIALMQAACVEHASLRVRGLLNADGSQGALVVLSVGGGPISLTRDESHIHTTEVEGLTTAGSLDSHRAFYGGGVGVMWGLLWSQLRVRAAIEVVPSFTCVQAGCTGLLGLHVAATTIVLADGLPAREGRRNRFLAVGWESGGDFIWGPSPTGAFSFGPLIELVTTKPERTLPDELNRSMKPR